MTAATDLTAVHLVTLGCARNDVDSAELAGRLTAGGFRLVDDPDEADAVMVNTCGFIEQAKKDSIDQIIEAAEAKETGRATAVVAVGCMAERYGRELADDLTEADAVLGFDDYADIATRLQSILAGERHQSHTPRDRRSLLPITPVARQAARAELAIPGHGGTAADDLVGGPASGPPVIRHRIGHGPMSPLKLASGCDRRCSFCAIPSFRGAYVSRTPQEIVAEAQWMVSVGVKEVFLVSENSSSYGKDLGDIRLLEEQVLPRLAEIEGLERIRVSYLQPAEMRPGLIEAMVGIDKVASYFDLSFQHAAPGLLRRMRRFGDPEQFLGLIARIRQLDPYAGIRSNVIVGFPGETGDDVQTLADFLVEARLDAIGVFGYSDEEGTEAVGLDGHVDADEIDHRAERIRDLADALVDQRAEERVGEHITVLIEEIEDDEPVGRAVHQGPEVDGTTILSGAPARVGDLVPATVIEAVGADLHARIAGASRGSATR